VRPSLVRPSLFALTWQACTWGGWALVLASIAALSPSALTAMGAPLAMIVAVIALSELRPIVMSRLAGNPVSISLAFVFAAMYVWGLYPALILQAGAVLLAELLQRKPFWKILFNVGQYVISVAAAWLVILLSGAAASPFDPHDGLSGSDLGWLLGSWIVYHVVNLALVGGLAGSGGQTWWESFTEEFWFYTVSVLAVLALSPLIAIVAVAYPGSWTLLPLLLLPLMAVQKTAQMSREKEHQALHDPLTGLPNRLLLSDRIDQALARGSRLDGRVAVLFLDVDLFKVVNDSLGHAAGDSLLMEMAERLASVLRPGDTLSRFGGDEFVIVCEDVPEVEVERLADRVALSMMDPFRFEGRSVTVTVSIGIAVASTTTDAQTLLRDADAAMYRAKAAGRNQAVVFDEAMHEQAAARLDAEFGLRQALERGELRVFYQPVVDVLSEALVGVEALVRWQHPTRGLLAPDEFVPVAEETGLILPLGSWVLQTSLEQVQQWRQQLPEAEGIWVAVNLSGRQFRAPSLITTIESAIESAAIPPSAVRLEITESVVMAEIGTTVDTLNAIRALGVGLAVDDFGTGYSSLSYLRSLPVSTIKIDKSFVLALGGGDPASLPLVDAIVSMADALGLEVVAEGVETPVQRELLRGLGTRFAQGFLWSRPLAAPDLSAWVTARRQRAE
jgi:diguanylate cyclase (GGDEF)-like protein